MGYKVEEKRLICIGYATIGLKPICYCIGLAVLLRARLPIVMIAKL